MKQHVFVIVYRLTIENNHVVFIWLEAVLQVQEIAGRDMNVTRVIYIVNGMCTIFGPEHLK